MYVCSDRVNLFKERVFISVKQGFIDYSQGPSATALYIHDLVVNHSTWTNINIDEMKMWNAWFVAFSVMASIRSVECTQDMHIGHKGVFPISIKRQELAIRKEQPLTQNPSSLENQKSKRSLLYDLWNF